MLKLDQINWFRPFVFPLFVVLLISATPMFCPGVCAEEDKLLAPFWIQGTGAVKKPILCLRDDAPFIVQGERPYLQKISPEERKVKQIDFPYPLEPISLSATSEGKLYFVARDKVENKFYLEGEEGLKSHILPEEITEGHLAQLSLAASKYGIAFRISNLIYILEQEGDGEVWRKVEIPPVRAGKDPSSFVVGNEGVFLGYAMGESGGALVAFDRKKKEFFLTRKVSNINYMCVDRGGRLWFTCTSNYFLDVAGSLHSFAGEKVFLHASTQTNASRSSNWNYPATIFSSLAFDKANQIYLGTSSQGVFKSDKGKFVRVSKGFEDGGKSSRVDAILPIEEGILFSVADHGVYLQRYN